MGEARVVAEDETVARAAQRNALGFDLRRREALERVEHLAQARLGSTRGDKDAELAVVKHRVVGEAAALVEDKDGHAAALEQKARTR